MSISEPTVFGPGTWFAIHVMAREANTPQKKMNFIEFMNKIKKVLPCVVCRTHCSNYIETHPFKDEWTFMEKGKDLGMFRWSWKFHNAVNKRLHKPEVSWEEALQKFQEDGIGVCQSGCGDGTEESTTTPSRALIVNHSSAVHSKKKKFKVRN